MFVCRIGRSIGHLSWFVLVLLYTFIVVVLNNSHLYSVQLFQCFDVTIVYELVVSVDVA